MKMKTVDYKISIDQNSKDEDKKYLVKVINELIDRTNEQANVIDQIVEILLKEQESQKTKKKNSDKLRNLLEN